MQLPEKLPHFPKSRGFINKNNKSRGFLLDENGGRFVI